MRAQATISSSLIIKKKKAARTPHKYKDEETVNPQTERESKAKRLARFIAYWQITPV
jgi:hypothetical protein